MPSIAFLASVALSLGVQAEVAVPLPSGGLRGTGIVETPGNRRTPLLLKVHFGDTINSTYQRDLHDARRDIDRRRDNGELTRREARQLRREAAMIDTLAERYSRDGLSDSERRELDMHAQNLRSQAAVRGTRPSP